MRAGAEVIYQATFLRDPRGGEGVRPPAQAGARRRLLRHGGGPVLRQRGPRVPVRPSHRRERRAAVHRDLGTRRAEEKAALEQFIDLVGERRRRFPDLHVYHYASYEVTALKRLAGAHGTHEEELDQLLRDEVFVDLYKVVRESMLISQPSYSIKKVEAFYMEQPAPSFPY
jgi:hypothetical protein